MGHPQPPTPPVQTDNSTAEGIINLWVQPNHTKAMDMRFHWLHDRGVNQKQFRKHHSSSHHRQIRGEILTPYQVVLDFQVKMEKIRTQ
jgi:hypothetical protein